MAFYETIIQAVLVEESYIRIYVIYFILDLIKIYFDKSQCCSIIRTIRGLMAQRVWRFEYLGLEKRLGKDRLLFSILIQKQ